VTTNKKAKKKTATAILAVLITVKSLRQLSEKPKLAAPILAALIVMKSF